MVSGGLAACTTPALCLAVCRWAGPRCFGSPTLRGGSVPHGVWHIPVPRRSGVAASRRSEMPVCRRRCCSIFRSLGVPVPGFSARPPSPVSRSPPGSPAASEPPYAAVAIGLLPLALVVVLVIGLAGQKRDAGVMRVTTSYPFARSSPMSRSPTSRCSGVV